MEKRRRKKDKLQQKFEAQGLQNCRSRNVDLNFGTQGTNKQKENNRKENEGKFCAPVCKLREGKMDAAFNSRPASPFP